MKNNLDIRLLSMLFATVCISLTFSVQANNLTPISNYSYLSIGDFPNNGGNKDKKKQRRHKKSRRHCTYCPPMRTFEGGQMEVTVKAGLVPTYVMDHATVKVPPITFGLDYRVSERFSLGFSAGHSASESQQQIIDDGIAATWTNRHFFFGIRPGIHITSVENWDFYGGMSLGFHISNVEGNANVKEYDLSAMESHMGIEPTNIAPSFFGFVGVRYVVSPKWILYCEVGYDVSIFSVGGSYLLFQ